MGKVLICSQEISAEVEQMQKLLQELQWQVSILCEKTPERSLPCPVMIPSAHLKDWRAWLFFLQSRPDLIVHVNPVAPWGWPSMPIRFFKSKLSSLWRCPQITWVGGSPRRISGFLRSSQLVLCSDSELLRQLLQKNWVKPGQVDLLDIHSPALFADEFLNQFNRRLEALLSHA